MADADPQTPSAPDPDFAAQADFANPSDVAGADPSAVSTDEPIGSTPEEEAAPVASPGVEDSSLDDMLSQASFDDPTTLAATETANAPLPDTESFDLPNFNQVIQDAQVSSIDLLRDVELNVKIELGRSRMLVEDVLKLGEGSVVELDKLAGDPVDVFVNDRLVARGEVLVLNDNFCVRVNEIVAALSEDGL